MDNNFDEDESFTVQIPTSLTLIFVSETAKNHFLECLSSGLDIRVELGMNDSLPLFEVKEVSVNVKDDDGYYIV